MSARYDRAITVFSPEAGLPRALRGAAAIRSRESTQPSSRDGAGIAARASRRPPAQFGADPPGGLVSSTRELSRRRGPLGTFTKMMFFSALGSGLSVKLQHPDTADEGGRIRIQDI